jgi:hypothetical protein
MKTCLTTDLDGDESRAIVLAPCGDSCTPTSMNAPVEGSTLKVRNEDEGGDFDGNPPIQWTEKLCRNRLLVGKLECDWADVA